MSHAIVDEQIKKAAEFYQNSSLGYRAVATRFGLDWQAMRRAFIKMGIKPKPANRSRGRIISGVTEICYPACGATFPAQDCVA